MLRSKLIHERERLDVEREREERREERESGTYSALASSHGIAVVISARVAVYMVRSSE